MIDERTVKDEIGQISALQVLVRAYAEIASIKMKKTRAVVLSNRAFLSDINSIFEDVRASYAQEVLALAKKRKSLARGKVTFLAHNGKTVSVLLSANAGLYGDIIKSTFDLFMNEVKQNKSEVTIVGKQGLALFQEADPDKPRTYFELADDKIKTDDLAKIISHIVQYEIIHVFYGKFHSVITQVPSTLAISAEISLSQDKSKKIVKYVFEPSLEKILMFFETEIFASLFEQVVRESLLAKYASRVMAMDKADQNINKSLGNLEFVQRRLWHKINNRKQLNRLSNVLINFGGI